MGVTAMRSFILLLVAFAFVEASNIVCKTRSSSKTVTVEDGDSFNYKTQKGKKYKGNADCTTNYVMGSSCAKMSFSCTKFNINNKDKKLCKKGDKMNIKSNGKTKSYCKKKKPKVTSTGDISVTFTSDTKKHSSGATCKVSCMEAATSETTTMPTTTPGSLTRKELSDYPRAVCNDGSNATYYYSDNAFSADHLLIYLQGGGSCQDVQSCNLRCNNPDSAFRCTAPQDETVPAALNFLLEDEDLNPPFYDFGKIYVPYCSSDIWIGTADASPANGNYFFHGKDIVRAVVDDLKKATNMAGMNQIVLLGTSAGGFGTQNVCDFVAENFKAENSNVDVRCIADSGDRVPPVGLNCTPEVDAQSFWGGESDESCMNAGAACGNFVTLYNYIETPLMVVHNYIDPTVSGQCAPALDASNIDYWNQWRQEIETLASEVMLAKPDNGFFIPNCYFHVLTKNEKAWNRLPVPLVGSDNEILLKDIIKNWTTGTGPVVAIDDPLVSNSNCGTPPSGF